MHTLSHITLTIPFSTWLATVLDRFVAAMRRRRARAQARLAAQAFERLDDRTLRDLGFYRGDAGAIAAELHGLCPPTLRRVIQRL